MRRCTLIMHHIFLTDIWPLTFLVVSTQVKKWYIEAINNSDMVFKIIFHFLLIDIWADLKLFKDDQTHPG